MPVTTTYPGVYLTEIPSGSRTITGIATSITAFVGSALRGPVDEPVPLASFADFERTFGGLWRSSGLGYAVRDFYLNGGGAAIVVRVAHGEDDDPDLVAAAATLDAGGLGLRATGPGAWANGLIVEVGYPADADATEVGAAQGVDPDDLFSLTIRESAGPDAFVETLLNLTVADGPRQADVVLASQCRGGPRPSRHRSSLLRQGRSVWQRGGDVSNLMVRGSPRPGPVIPSAVASPHGQRAHGLPQDLTRSAGHATGIIATGS